jgi:ribonucleases P/MRP protein subunit RPP40
MIFNLVVMTVILLLDFSKACDNVVHSLLCSKLSSLFRFHGTAVELIRSYLSDRYQFVVLVAREVEQGSVLGPILFSLFINDIASRISHCRYHLYTDDVQ